MKSFLKLATVAVVALTTSHALADTVVYDSNGFEPSRFGPGSIIGQDAGVKPWTASQQVFVPGATTSANVQSAFSVAGQAVRLDRTGDANGRFYPIINATPAERFVNISWDMSVTASSVSSTSGAFGPFFGVQFYGGNTVGTATVLGGFGVDSANGELIYQNAMGQIVAAPIQPVTLNAASFNTFDILADFTNRVYSVFLNGDLLATTSFNQANLGAAGNFYAAPLIAVEASGNVPSLSATGTAYVDNYFIGTMVPEPASLSLLGLAGLALLRRNRR